MCGITGYWTSSSDAFKSNYVVAMADKIAHRGPDDSGIWFDHNARIAMAHRRLSIIDLSQAGHQPMHSQCGRFCLVYNGEIYNHIFIRAELEKDGWNYRWKGHSDTETLLAAITHWGLERTLKLCNGMFAFALWNIHERILTLARDRMGEKPLYYGMSGKTFFFTSELKSLSAHPDWHGIVDRTALTLFMRHMYVPEPWSIFSGLKKLPPAHIVTIKNHGAYIDDPKCYWNLSNVAANGVSSRDFNFYELIPELEKLLSDSVGLRMMSDVPIGSFLSGGYDSSIITAFMQMQSDKPVKTFSIGFHEKLYNEANHAKAVANHLGTDHTELYVSPEDAISVIPKLPQIYDEPFADSSQIPTYLVCQLARRDVKVCLSGDGGDELFCGYNRYVLGYDIWKKINYLPSVLKKILSKLLIHVPGEKIDFFQKILPRNLQVSNLADRLPKLGEVLSHNDNQSFYNDLISHWKSYEKVVINSENVNSIFSHDQEIPEFSDFRETMMYIDMMSYLPGDILTKVDRASMAVSLEARVPMLDHRLIEFVWKIPFNYKYRDGQGKWLLREVLYKYIPKKLIERPKMGFGVPIDQWLRGPIREWAEELLDEGRLKQEGYLNPKLIRQKWEEHLSGKCRWHYLIWDVLMFQAWLEHQKMQTP